MTDISTNQKPKIGKFGSKKLRWLASGSMAAAAMFLASAPEPVEAQLRAPGMMVQNYPTGNSVTIPRPDMAQNQPQVRAPDFMARDVRISAPLAMLPVNDIRITAPVALPTANQPQARAPDFIARNVRISAPIENDLDTVRINAPVTLPNAHQPQITAPDLTSTYQAQSQTPDFGARDVAISAPIVADLGNIRISSEITLPNSYQPQTSPDFAPVEQPQAVIPPPGVAGINVRAFAQFDNTQINFLPGAAEDIIVITAPESIINWTTFDAGGSGVEVTFLPNGGNLRFTSDDVEYTVLNRIFTPGFDSAIRIDGNIRSDTSGGGPVNGNVWFYSPGGIIVGATAFFDVGGLVLTANDIDTSGGLFGTGGTIRFRGAADSNAAVTIEANNDAIPQINANTNGSYVAIVAPRVVQGGDVSADGSIAYIAAEQADLTIDNGLFDIAVTVGTTDANGVVHTGTTTGASAVPILDNPGTLFVNEANRDARAIYMVAVPKNDAITMLVGGNLGYQPAASASIVNGEVILTTSANVSVGGSVQSAVVDIDKTIPATTSGNIDIRSTTFSSSVEAFADDTVSLTANAVSGSVRATNAVGSADLDITAGKSINIAVTDAQTIFADGNIVLKAGSGNIGGNVNININPGGGGDAGTNGLNTFGDLTIDTSASGADDFFIIRNNGNTGIGQDATAGDIVINIANNGGLNVSGNTNLIATAQGGKGEIQNGFGRGGNIALNLTGTNSRVNFGGNATFDSGVSSAQSGKIGGNGGGLIGSDSTAGNITVDIQDGGFTLDPFFFQSLRLEANAFASGGTDDTVAQSNDATSGNIAFRFTGGTHSIGRLVMNSNAAGAQSFDANGNRIGGMATVGSLDFQIDGANLALDDIQANFLIFNGTPTAGTLSDITMNITNGAVLDIRGDFALDTSVNSQLDNVVEAAPNLTLNVDNSTFNFGALRLTSSIDRSGGGSANDTTPITAGDLTFSLTNGAIANGRTMSLTASARNTNNGGIGIGGNILIDVNNSSLNLTGDIRTRANGVGAVADAAGDANRGGGFGGTVTFRLQGAAGVMTVDDIFADADGFFDFGGEEGGGFGGFGGDGLGDGGDAAGGTITIDILGGNFTGDSINFGADGTGGDGTSGIFDDGLSGVVSLAEPLTGPIAASPFALVAATGDGGVGVGGDIVFNLNGGTATIATLNVTANGIGGSGGSGDFTDGTTSGRGGDGIGGTSTFNAISGTLNVTNLNVTALGNGTQFTTFVSRGGRGGFGGGIDGGDGGIGTGGTAIFNLDGTSVINANNVLVATDGFGGNAGDSGTDTDFSTPGPTPTTIPPARGGAGGNATGGNAIFNNTTGTISFGQLTVRSNGSGGVGGDSFGVTGTPAADGGNGGAGTGGTATINLNQDDLTNPVYTVDASATGGNGGDGLNSGNGGDATAGIAAININNVQVDLDDPTILANAVGGNAGLVNEEGGLGGNGGSATGGTAMLQVTGVNGNIPLGFIILESNATGGNGANGGNHLNGGTAGDGGNGGDATGGSSQLVARTGGTINITSGTINVASSGTGGTGGVGGSFDMINGGTAGNGGNGGSGAGGSPTLLAQGGTITANNINFLANGIGGNGGLGGGDFTVQFGTTGNGGNGSGGNPILEVQEGSPGIITLGATIMQANGTGGTGTIAGTAFGGRIEITDTSTDPAGLISLASLNATALTGSSGPLSGFFVTGNSGAINVIGDLTVNVGGNIEYAFDGTGQMTVGGNASLTSGANILVSHTNNTTPVNSIDATGTFAATAQGNFNSMAGSRIVAGGTAAVRAEQNATVADIAGVGSVNISAMQNVNVTNAAVTGIPFVFTGGAGQVVLAPTLVINAGFDPTPTPTPLYDPNFNATIDGNLSSTGNIAVNAGGNATFVTGSNTVSDNGLIVRTGDDIIIQSGASLVAANNPATTPSAANPFVNVNNLILQAGGITDLSTPRITPISSIIAAGDLNANGFAVFMTANAIDGLGGTITASSISADINDAQTNAAITATGQSNDNGLLSGQCLQGNVCLGTLNADNIVQIGQNSNNDVVQAIIESGSVSANDILITIRRDVVMGTDGVATTLNASNQFLIESTEGDINLRDAAVSSNNLQVSAVNGSLLGTGSLTSTNDIGITVGQDINAMTINAGGQLTTVLAVGGALENNYNVPGNISVGTLTQGANQRVQITAGGNINFGQINLPNRNINLLAGGDAFLGGTTGATNILIRGQNVGFNSLDATNAITLDATNGNITGAAAGTITAGGLINMDATGDIGFGAANVGTTFNADAGGAINFGNVTGFDLQLRAGGDIIGTSVISPNASGSFSDRALLNAGGDVNVATVTGRDILDIRGVNVTVGALSTNGGNVFTGTVVATGAVDLGSVVGTRYDIQGTSVNITSIDISGRATVNATTGGITTGALSATQLDFDAVTDVTITDATDIRQFNIDTAGAINFGDVTGIDIQFRAGGDITGTSVISPNASGSFLDRALLNAGGDINVTTVTGRDILDIDGTNITIGALSSNGGNLFTADILATGTVDLGNIVGTRYNIQGTSVDITSLNITGQATINATTGNVTAGSLNAVDLNLDAAGDINFVEATGSNTINMTAIGGINGGNLTATNTLNLNAGNIAIGDATAANINFTSATNILFDTITSPNSVTLTAANGLIGKNTGSGDINSDGNISLTSQSVDVGNLISGGNILANITLADAAFGLLDATGSVTVTGAAAVAVDTANSGGDTSIIGTSVTLNNGAVTGDLTLNATNGDVNGNGTIGAGRAIDIDATGDVTFGSVTAGRLFTVDAGGSIDFTSAATSRFSIVMNAGADITGGSLMTAPVSGLLDNIDLQAGGALTITDASAGNSIILVGASIDAGTLDAVSSIIATTGGAANIDTANSGDDTSITGSSVTLNNGAIGRNLTLNATAGDVNGTGTINAGSAIDIDATGDVTFGSVTAGRLFTVDAGGSIDFTSAATSRFSIVMNAGADITGGSLMTAPVSGLLDNIDLQAGGALTITDASAGNSIILAGASIDAGTLDAVSNITATTGGGGQR